MNLKLIAVAAIAPFAAFALNSVARAQEAKPAFSGKCTDYSKDAATCEATGWCHQVTRKPITLPDGKQFTPAAYCAFKSGFGQAWKAQKQASN